ncbi:MAG: 2-amino-4-ketopentanoate thiolase [Firmicutes bacterium]|nr:2-amino-4-ketopentanoate thiolase [Bacillota bacterium]
MFKAKQGDWVQINSIVLEAGNRAPNIPKETQEVSLELRVRGFLLNKEAELNDQVRIETYIGREFSGRLERINPAFEHSFGRVIPELLPIGRELKTMLEGSDKQ